MLDRWDTGYRSSDWAERPAWARRLDYHDSDVDLTVMRLREILWCGCRAKDDGRVFDHVRNTLVLLLREIGGDYRMPPEHVRSFVQGLADQVYREEKIRTFGGCNDREVANA